MPHHLYKVTHQSALSLTTARPRPFSSLYHLTRVENRLDVVSTLRFTTTSALPLSKVIDTSYPLEEETVRGYRSEHYYPVKLGEIFVNRYKTIGKLGFGSTSTVWLCRDLQEPGKYIALKVYINNLKYHRELPIYEEINALQTDCEGQDFVRKMYDSFEIQGPHGNHICLVQQPLGLSLAELRSWTSDGVFDAKFIRPAFRCILCGLQFLHQKVQVIHTDLQPSNIILGINDDSVFARFEQSEAEDRSPCKQLEDRTIYLSRPMPFSKGAPYITDLSEARFGDRKHTDLIMPDVYRAPEVILGIPWGYPVDIWGLAMVLWDLFEPRRIFLAVDSDGRYSEAHHLAEMISIIGMPPREFVLRGGRKAAKYFDRNGNWSNIVPIPDLALDDVEQRLVGEEKHLFLNLIRKLLRWVPEERPDSEQVYRDEWLLTD